jgi:hypothetical protein
MHSKFKVGKTGETTRNVAAGATFVDQFVFSCYFGFSPLLWVFPPILVSECTDCSAIHVSNMFFLWFCFF